MDPTDASAPGQGRSDQPGEEDYFAKEKALLAKAQCIAQQIVNRVNKALGDTESHQALPTEEKPPLL